jgi:hypothetical protein
MRSTKIKDKQLKSIAMYFLEESFFLGYQNPAVITLQFFKEIRLKCPHH